MQDGLTRKLKTRPARTDDSVLGRSFKVVVLSGPRAGAAYELDRRRVTLGRGPGVDLAFDDAALSRQHAAFDFEDGGYRIRDLGSTNGLRVNGNRVQLCDLDNGDHIEMGTLVFQLVVEERETPPEVWDLSTER
ncbi:MAG TPA: FHA domain-containing protein [Candidatus Polarisedimenticolaceae bacterium]|nr:FHA domain-containing protein [Candidatus Polarisedimenticolaceae bacterium]